MPSIIRVGQVDGSRGSWREKVSLIADPLTKAGDKEPLIHLLENGGFPLKAPKQTWDRIVQQSEGRSAGIATTWDRWHLVAENLASMLLARG